MSMITADFATLMDQSSMTVEKWMYDAHKYLKDGGIKDPFTDTPELVAAFVNAASRDLQGSVIAKALFEIAFEMANKETGVDQSYELQGIADGVENVAKMIGEVAGVLHDK